MLLLPGEHEITLPDGQFQMVHWIGKVDKVVNENRPAHPANPNEPNLQIRGQDQQKMADQDKPMVPDQDKPKVEDQDKPKMVDQDKPKVAVQDQQKLPSQDKLDSTKAQAKGISLITLTSLFDHLPCSFSGCPPLSTLVGLTQEKQRPCTRLRGL